ncbi:sensor histidine kinase [Haloechinothrix salitolerans]|uniref:Sensor histidine kinase n=1 Tax=Haloechinothrix salitolerans TaxID=926830 RepID=A0ABW2C2G4_9PSEU
MTDSAGNVERVRRLTWWSSVGLAVAFGVGLVASIVTTEPSVTLAAIAVAGTVAGSAGAASLLHLRLAADAERGLAFVPAALAVAGALIVTVASQWATGSPTLTWAVVAGVVIGAIACAAPSRWRPRIVLVATASTTTVAVTARFLARGDVSLPDTAFGAVLIVLLAVALRTGVWYLDVVVQLEHARRVEGELAVADERLRFAADLHDAHGHHLHVIALESELASRLAETDPQAAVARMRDVHQHAQNALAETRNLVHGYRTTPLTTELTNATRVLVAAGIEGRLHPGSESAADSVPSDRRQLLGQVVREATTNVLRHSHADEATLTLWTDADGVRLRVRNNGAVAPATEPGSGLATLAERLAVSGGVLDWHRDGEWFTITALLPDEEGART